MAEYGDARRMPRRERIYLSGSSDEEEATTPDGTVHHFEENTFLGRRNGSATAQPANNQTRGSLRQRDDLEQDLSRPGHGFASSGSANDLTEVVAPPPVSQNHQRQSGDDLEQDLSRSGRGFATSGPPNDLTEVVAPPPVSDDHQRQSGDDEKHLEDQDRDDAAAADDTLPTHQPTKLEGHDSEEPKVSKRLTELYTISYLIFFAIWGTLARLGTQWITFYPGTPIVTPVLWANFAGSFIMGFMSEDQNLFRPHSSTQITMNGEKSPNGRSNPRKDDFSTLTRAEATKRKKTIPLYIGITTGFCGSFTSFSSFARDVFLALSNNLPTPLSHPYPGLTISPSTTSTISRNGGYSFEALLQVIIATVALSLGGLIAGGQLATFLSSLLPKIHGPFVTKYLDRLMVLLAFGCWLGAVFLAIWPPDRPDGSSSRGSWSNETWRGEVLFALVFAPLGCLLRFYASARLNSIVPAFPLGTFAVNMLGTAIVGMCFDIQHVGVGVMGRAGGGRVGCQVLQGVMDGFCGCLTTVSTWALEIVGLKRKHGWLYAGGSVAGALGLMVVIMGSVRWTTGFVEPVCDTGYTSKVHG